MQDAYPEATVTGTAFLSAFTTKVAVYALARGYAGQVICTVPVLQMTLALTSDPTQPARSGGITTVKQSLAGCAAGLGAACAEARPTRAVVPGLCASYIARGRVKSGEANNGGVALAGIILGIISIIAGLAFIAIWVGLFREVGAGGYIDCLQRAGQDSAAVQQCSDEFRESMTSRFTDAPTP